MKTVSLKLPDTLDDQLTTVSRQRGTSKSAFIREALEAYLTYAGEASLGTVLEAAQDLCGCVEGPEDLSTHPQHMVGYGQ
jgi:predicted DNA-binding protein